jgi:hypothetical protein
VKLKNDWQFFNSVAISLEWGEEAEIVEPLG